MIRHSISPRSNWQQIVESTGMIFHTDENGRIYWDESACYEFTSGEIDDLEAVATELHARCLEAVGQIIRHGWWDELAIPETARPVIQTSWERQDQSLYGRFDVLYNSQGVPKMLEYNADTPTSLLEASVTQWYWLQDFQGKLDQFNSIHEKLIAAWPGIGCKRIHFVSVSDHPEDEQTVNYLQDTCLQAGLQTKRLGIGDIGWDRKQKIFVDLENEKIEACFKLYPWEWMWKEEFGKFLPLRATQFIEPTWKMLLSNKGILPILWRLFPDHPNLLPAFYESPAPGMRNFARKPLLGREGANIRLVKRGMTLAETTGIYGDNVFIYQELVEPAGFEGNHPTLGLWIIKDEPAGLGIREDSALIAANQSRFIPHYFRP